MHLQARHVTHSAGGKGGSYCASNKQQQHNRMQPTSERTMLICAKSARNAVFLECGSSALLLSPPPTSPSSSSLMCRSRLPNNPMSIGCCRVNDASSGWAGPGAFC